MTFFDTACAIVDPRPDDFERAMSALALAAGLLERNPPQTKAQHNRLSDRTLRIARVEVSSERNLIGEAA